MRAGRGASQWPERAENPNKPYENPAVGVGCLVSATVSRLLCHKLALPNFLHVPAFSTDLDGLST